MTRLLLAFTVLLSAHPVAAQLVAPTTAYTFAWDYAGPAYHHFDVRYTASGSWTNVGRQMYAPVPALTAGAYLAQVRTCATATATTCPQATLAFTVGAQAGFNPTKIEFIASTDHATTVNGTALVTGYQLDMMVGTATGSLAFSVNLGKPTPGTGNLISVPVPLLATLTNGSYVATVSALGPGGMGKSAPSAAFSKIGPAAPPTAVRIVE